MSVTFHKRGLAHDVGECSILNCALCESAMHEWSCDQCGEPMDPPIDLDDEYAHTCDDCLELKPEGNMADVKLRRWETEKHQGWDLLIDGVESVGGVAGASLGVSGDILFGVLGTSCTLPASTDEDTLREAIIKQLRERCAEVLEALS